MGFIDCLSTLNAQLHTCNKEKLINLKGYYMSMYRFYMVKLYDNGYIDDPTIYDETQIRRNIVEMGVNGMMSVLGYLDLNSERVRYAMYKNKDTQIQEFLSLLYNTLKYKEYCDSLDRYYEAFMKDRESYKLRIAARGGMYRPEQSLELTKANLRVFTEDDCTVDYFSIEYFEIETILKSLNIPVEDYVVDKDLTLKDMLGLSSVIFGSHPPASLDGEYSPEVKNWVMQFNRSLESHFYSHNTSLIYEEFNKILEQLEDVTILALCKNKIFYERPYKYKKYPLGLFKVMCGYEGDNFDTVNDVNGYVGECYPIDYLEQEGYSYFGAPLLVNGRLVYDREQTNIDSQSWFSYNNIDYEFEEKTILSIKSESDAIQATKEGNLGILKIAD